MTEAIFGLVGVLVGGLLNGAGLWLVERHRSRRAARTAARLLLPELIEIERILTIRMWREPKWRGMAEFPHERWDRYESTLAPVLSKWDWAALTSLYESLRLFEDEASYHAKLDTPVDGESLEYLHLTQGVAADAMQVRHRLGDVPTEEERRALRA
jgi:hypothetical protein